MHHAILLAIKLQFLFLQPACITCEDSKNKLQILKFTLTSHIAHVKHCNLRNLDCESLEISSTDALAHSNAARKFFLSISDAFPINLECMADISHEKKS